jgi:ubiquinone/menaquinone biosynthesis C-methylase UbiE
MNQAAFFELFHPGLPRLGPGSSTVTTRALSFLTGLPQAPDVLDVGCGNGGQTLDLARQLPGARITAVDVLPIYLEELDRRAAKVGVANRISTLVADMWALPFPDASFDLIWSEGAVYNMGFEVGLAAWRRLLRSRGMLAISEIAWLKPDPPAELRSFWQAEYPGMEGEASLLAHVSAQGYELLGHFRLSPECWWSDFYDHLWRELEPFRLKHARESDWLAVAEAVNVEMNMHRNYSEYYGYSFFLCRRTD